MLFMGRFGPPCGFVQRMFPRISLFLIFIWFHHGYGQLKLNYYSETCRNAEHIVKEEVGKLYSKHYNNAIPWIRNLFHDCIVESCDASLLLETRMKDGIVGEEESPRSVGLRGFKFVNEIKQLLDEECPGTVSCADVMALAARDAVALLGGPQMEMRTGRRDGTKSYYDVVGDYLPDHNDSLPLVLSRFEPIGIDTEGVVALLGAHSVGRVHCVNLVDRLYPTADPTMDPTLANYLKSRCPIPGEDMKQVEYARNDRVTSFVMDNMYYKHVLAHQGLMQVDQQLTENATTLGFVERFGSDNEYFHEQFGKNFLILSENNPLTGEEGEIRNDCRRVNERP